MRERQSHFHRQAYGAHQVLKASGRLRSRAKTVCPTNHRPERSAAGTHVNADVAIVKLSAYGGTSFVRQGQTVGTFVALRLTLSFKV